MSRLASRIILTKIDKDEAGISKVKLLVGLALLAALVVCVLLVSSKSPAKNNSSLATTSSSTTNLRTVNAPAPSEPYTSSSDNFTIDFPASPTVTDSTFNSPTAGTVPVTTYREQAASGTENVYYTVYVDHYPANYQFASDYLDQALQTYAANLNDDYPGTVVSSQQTKSLLNGSALYGLLSVPIKLGSSNSTTNTPDYVTLTVHGQKVYEVSGYGMSSSDYNSFINSFQYTN